MKVTVFILFVAPQFRCNENMLQNEYPLNWQTRQGTDSERTYRSQNYLCTSGFRKIGKLARGQGGNVVRSINGWEENRIGHLDGG